MQDITGLTLSELEENLKESGYPLFHAKQIFSWIYKKGVLDFNSMSDLSAELRKYLKAEFFLGNLKLVKTLKSRDETEKFLFELKDKNLIEAVIIPAENRITGCISTQVGCKFACKFCASGLSGFKRNLTVPEIIDEALYLKSHCPGGKLTHLVFMGTGEPLDNYENLLKAIRVINSAAAFNIGARRITISTCGIIPGIKRLQEEELQVELSISLHAADDKLRSKIMPVNHKYPLVDLIKCCHEYIERTNRQITFEYILVKGLNSDLLSAQKLAMLLKNLRLAKVNLIPANPVLKPAGKIIPPSGSEVISFKDYLFKAGVNVTLRRERGQDIDAACGQLRLKYEKN